MQHERDVIRAGQARLWCRRSRLALEREHAGGFRLVYRDTPPPYYTSRERDRKILDLTYTIGLVVGEGGNISSVAWDSPLFNEGVTVDATIVAVNGQAYSKDVLDDAVKAAKDGKAPIELLVKEFDRFRTVKLDYHGGLRYPHLERIQGKPDYLTPIFTARK